MIIFTKTGSLASGTIIGKTQKQACFLAGYPMMGRYTSANAVINGTWW
jgi:hypothetical protein